MDGSSCDSIADFEYLSGQYPEARWVVTQQMWSGFNGVLHLMWRRKNIYLDTSWLHMRDTLEMVRGEFGIERLLFGIGNRAQYGAAVAALAHAEFSDAEREAVAHGNLEKLLGLPPLEKKLFSATPQLAEKPLWNSFKAGGKLDGVRVVDSHVHDGPFTRGWVLRDYGRAALEKSMTRLGIDRHIVIGEQALFGDILSGNAEAEREFSPFSDRFKGYFVFNPHFKNTVNEKILDDFFSRGYFVGFKLLPAYWNVPMDDPGYELVWQYAEKHHLPILIHTWGDAEPLKNIAPRYPNACFPLGHSGGRDEGRKQAMEIAEVARTRFSTPVRSSVPRSLLQR